MTSAGAVLLGPTPQGPCGVSVRHFEGQGSARALCGKPSLHCNDVCMCVEGPWPCGGQRAR